RADDGVVRVQLESALPAANGFLAFMTPQLDVAELQVHVGAELRIDLGRADECLQCLVVTGGAVVEIAEVLVQLRNAGILLDTTLGGGARTVVVRVSLENGREVVQQNGGMWMRDDTFVEDGRRTRSVTSKRSGQSHVVEPGRSRRPLAKERARRAERCIGRA